MKNQIWCNFYDWFTLHEKKTLESQTKFNTFGIFYFLLHLTRQACHL
jgi:hypothetical protein